MAIVSQALLKVFDNPQSTQCVYKINALAPETGKVVKQLSNQEWEAD